MFCNKDESIAAWGLTIFHMFIAPQYIFLTWTTLQCLIRIIDNKTYCHNGATEIAKRNINKNIMHRKVLGDISNITCLYLIN